MSNTKLYRLPVVWLSGIIFVAIIAACVLTIVISTRYADEPLPDTGEVLLRMPLGTQPVNE